MNVFRKSKELSNGKTYPVPFRHATSVIMSQYQGEFLDKGYLNSILNPNGDPDINAAINYGVEDVIQTEKLYKRVGRNKYQRVK